MINIFHHFLTEELINKSWQKSKGESKTLSSNKMLRFCPCGCAVFVLKAVFPWSSSRCQQWEADPAALQRCSCTATSAQPSRGAALASPPGLWRQPRQIWAGAAAVHWHTHTHMCLRHMLSHVGFAQTQKCTHTHICIHVHDKDSNVDTHKPTLVFCVSWDTWTHTHTHTHTLLVFICGFRLRMSHTDTRAINTLVCSCLFLHACKHQSQSVCVCVCVCVCVAVWPWYQPDPWVKASPPWWRSPAFPSSWCRLLCR